MWAIEAIVMSVGDVAERSGKKENGEKFFSNIDGDSTLVSLIAV